MRLSPKKPHLDTSRCPTCVSVAGGCCAFLTVAVAPPPPQPSHGARGSDGVPSGTAPNAVHPCIPSTWCLPPPLLVRVCPYRYGLSHGRYSSRRGLAARRGAATQRLPRCHGAGAYSKCARRASFAPFISGGHCEYADTAPYPPPSKHPPLQHPLHPAPPLCNTSPRYPPPTPCLRQTPTFVAVLHIAGLPRRRPLWATQLPHRLLRLRVRRVPRWPAPGPGARRAGSHSRTHRGCGRSSTA